ncbi:PilZ domain-containing protein [Sphingomonas sanguinis]|uniref:PilZ domain-containing protein n=1 Tax=Sphingomonas sanguinis TaxID=33051 RepID=UPI001C577E2F|nr:PilZ domain-containing protein [Sphingomonas sanguinis]QXT37465.1 PilZ domain-containing protein [Sphingomonas sanguinis]
MGRSGSGYKNREARRQVLIPCRIKSVRGWGDACIHNISSRGMMIACDDPLAPGEYLDLRRGSQVVIGRVVWRRDRFSGVRTQDVISAEAMINEPRLEAKPNGSRRSEERCVTRQGMAGEIDAARRMERSRSLSQAMQFGALGIFGLVAAVTIATQIGHVLAAPTARIARALSQ